MMLLSSTSVGCEPFAGGMDESLFRSVPPPIPAPAPASPPMLEGVDAAHPIVLSFTPVSFCFVGVLRYPALTLRYCSGRWVRPVKRATVSYLNGYCRPGSSKEPTSQNSPERRQLFNAGGYVPPPPHVKSSNRAAVNRYNIIPRLCKSTECRVALHGSTECPSDHPRSSSTGYTTQIAPFRSAAKWEQVRSHVGEGSTIGRHPREEVPTQLQAKCSS